MTTTDFTPWDRVRFIPPHANGNPKHKDCENGLVKDRNETFVFVVFCNRTGTPETHAKACKPQHLIHW